MSNTRHLIHASIAAFSILAIGIVLGVVLDRTMLLQGLSDPNAVTEEQQLDSRHQDFHSELAAELGLSGDQARTVHEILIRHQSAVDEAWVFVHTQLESVIDSVTNEIEAILDSAQRERLFEFIRERHGAPPPQTLRNPH